MEDRKLQPPPQDIEAARKMARIKAIDAAPLWSLNPVTMSLRCLRGEVPGAVQLGRIWYVTPAGMDAIFTKRSRRNG